MEYSRRVGEDTLDIPRDAFHVNEQVDRKESYALILLLSDLRDLREVLQYMSVCRIDLTRIESRDSLRLECPSRKEVLLEVISTNREIDGVIVGIQQLSLVDEVQYVTENDLKNGVPFPRHISDLDWCNHLVVKFEPKLATDHPGFHDEDYIIRRREIADIAFNYKHGDKIPSVEYTAEENATWKAAFEMLVKDHKQTACEEYLIEMEGLVSSNTFIYDRVPQLDDVSNYMKKKSGFVLRPVAGLVSSRDFLASLAFRVFQSTQYVRHPSKIHYSLDPDCIHELLGHVPMLCRPEFAEFSQEIGLYSLGITDKELEKLAALYWFTVEFGLCKTADGIRAYGAGLLSAYGELKHALSAVPKRLTFDAETVATTEYRDDDYQPTYYVVDSIQDMKMKLRSYAKKIPRTFNATYDPHTQTIQTAPRRHAGTKRGD